MRRPFLALVILLGCASSQKAASTAPAIQSQPIVTAVALDEPALMEKIRQSVETDPATAVTLADDGERRFPNSQLREEREALAIRALINLQRIGAARGRAYPFLERYPNGPYSGEVAAMTGVHLTPKGPPPP
ncbi:MAG TPA: hypothetical protein VF518_14210 [Polyangia bacterium]